ncbi:hypothetical protein LRD69_14400 [Streptomyces sp. JH14]|uniref:hypothetical protein n=1 Tax=Streptomyces sp. JH14 TaxID=2793630 RepID=UPI0023F62BB1|nr:hypothetical protein [Streptomyces sp. JH14]MDF6043315.1 hypothetical protein [Streptomyces sp. JH14]
MSSSDQQHPYGQEPGSGPGAGYGYAYGQEPQAAYGEQPYGQQAPYDPNGQAFPDPGVTQTWEGQTWDTQYQPAVQPAPQPQYGQPQYGQAQQDGQSYAQPQYGQAQQDGQSYAQQQYEQPYAQQQYEQPYAEAAPQPPQGATGSHPLPAEVQAAPGAVTAEAAAHDTSGYSAPTTLGNSRITDAQRARAEGRSPIIAPGMQPAAITAGLGLLLALGAAIGQYALFVPLVLLQAVTAAGWFRLNGMWPARQGIALAFAGGFVADVVLLAAGRENAPAAILGTLGIWVLLTVVLQLRSHAGADERMYGLMATVASAALAILAAGHLAAVPDAVTVGGVSVAVAVLARALPLPGPASVVVALLAAAGAGVAAGGLTDLGAKGALLGLAAGGCALIGLRAASYDYPSRFVHMTAGVALPLTAAAPAVYLIGRALS